jgi:hypothetical protein
LLDVADAGEKDGLPTNDLEVSVDLDRPPQQHLHIPLALPSLPVAILVNDHMQPRARARHAHVGHAVVPVGFDVGEGGEEDDVVF